MSIYNAMRTSTSGMAGQANRLGAVADNVANATTVGYKRADVEFSSFLIDTGPATYTSGGIESTTRRAISLQGPLRATQSPTDIALSGRGFLMVADADGRNTITRSGSFVTDGEGRMVNTAGFFLQGFPIENGVIPDSVTAGFTGLETVVIDTRALDVEPSEAGFIEANVPSTAAIVPAASLPTANAAGAQFSGKTSIVAYGNLGEQMLIDLYFAKSAALTWEVTAYDASTAAATGGPFPYSAPALATTTLAFDGTTGRLTGASANNIAFTVPGGQTLTIDLSKMSQFATSFTMIGSSVDGNPPIAAKSVEIGSDGIVNLTYENGLKVPVYRLPLADVRGPDWLLARTGNVFEESPDSGDIVLGFPQEGGLGRTVAGTLEDANVDIANELTEMIDAQRSYGANSKVFQTGAEMFDVLLTLKR
jgi:flagellar hook protein FlgE